MRQIVNVRQFASRSISYIHTLVVSIFIIFIIQSTIAMLALNQQQKFLLYPNAKEAENWEWREWHIDVRGEKYFNIYFSNIQSIFVEYSIRKSYSSTDMIRNVQNWYLQERGCKELFPPTKTEWTGYCSKRDMPPLTMFVAFPYQELNITNYGQPNIGTAITITTKWSVGIQMLLLPTDFYLSNPPDQ